VGASGRQVIEDEKASGSEPRRQVERTAVTVPRGGAENGRHQTLEATIGWSYDLLSADEQKLADVMSNALV
jgi:hypothetical protein